MTVHSNTMKDEYHRLAQHVYDKVLGSNENTPTSPYYYYWIGLAGGPGSGKTTVATAVADRINDRFQNHHASGTNTKSEEDVCIVVPMDGYHYSQHDLVSMHGEDAMLQRGKPFTFDAESLVSSISNAQKLQQEYLSQSQDNTNNNGDEKQSKELCTFPVYDRNISDPVPNGLTLRSHHRIVIVEGLYVLHKHDPRFAPLLHMWDETWFVKAPTVKLQKERLVQRSLKTWSDKKAEQWGPGKEGATKRVETNDMTNLQILAYAEDFADQVIVTHWHILLQIYNLL